MTNFVVSIVPADGIALLEVMTFAGTLMSIFVSRTEPVLNFTRFFLAEMPAIYMINELDSYQKYDDVKTDVLCQFNPLAPAR